MKKTILAAGLLFFCVLSCGQRPQGRPVALAAATDTAAVPPAPATVRRPMTAADIVLEKQFTYDRHTLADTFPYNKGVRFFQFDKMRERLFVLDSIQQDRSGWAILQNRQNKNGESPLVDEWHRNEYHLVTDSYGVERFQSVALYTPGQSVPTRYGHDGALVRVLGNNADSSALRVEGFNEPGVWEVKDKYVHRIEGPGTFTHAVMVDRTNQCIATVEKVDGNWLIRSMNPATTGAHNPPYGHPTPTGMFVVQEKKAKMLYNGDGSSALAGFAPWASRFCNGAYLHGVPTNNPNGSIIEFSATLGTIPRSHMCVRNASSHAKFIYDWAPTERTIVFVYD